MREIGGECSASAEMEFGDGVGLASALDGEEDEDEKEHCTYGCKLLLLRVSARRGEENNRTLTACCPRQGTERKKKDFFLPFSGFLLLLHSFGSDDRMYCMSTVMLVVTYHGEM